MTPVELELVADQIAQSAKFDLSRALDASLPAGIAAELKIEIRLSDSDGHVAWRHEIAGSSGAHSG